MRLIDIRNKLKKDYKDVVIFMKYGNFYRVFDDDCYIISGLFGYRIYDNKTGFPITEYNKVKEVLDRNNISYIFYNICECIKELNSYDLVLNYYKNCFYKKDLINILIEYDIIIELEKILNLVNRDKLNKLREKYER